mgnify:CR=1 FL=1
MPLTNIPLAGSYVTSSWRVFALAFFAGVFSATALPPWSFPLGIFGFSIFFFLIYRCTIFTRAISISWLFCFGYHLFGLQWISNALLIDGMKFAWLLPFAFVGIPAFLAIIPSLILAFFCRISLPAFWFMVVAATLWTLSEFLRGHLFTGFPWNLPAYIFSFSDPLLQIASLIGAYGLSWLVILFATGPSLLLVKEIRYLLRYKIFITLLFLIPLTLWVFGTVRLNSNSTKLDPSFVIRLVQGNIPQEEKWSPKFRSRNIERYIALSTIQNSRNSPNLIIWPETSIPALIEQDKEIRDRVTHFLEKETILIAGAPSLTQTKPNQPLNSVFILTPEGDIASRYDKAHLVPFGEYIPLKGWLPFPKLVTKFPDFKAGPGLTSIQLPVVGNISPLICYEVIFPGKVVSDDITKRPNLLINLTNDAWFGKSAGPYQHLEHARLRAIEEGIPLIRVANTGISASYDPFGRKLSEIALGKSDYVDQNLIKPLDSMTLYAKIGDTVYIILTIMIIVGTVLGKLFCSRKISDT